MRVLRWFTWLFILIWLYFQLPSLRSGNKKSAKRFVQLLTYCGTLGVKFGQYTSKRIDLFGKHTCSQLACVFLDNAQTHSIKHTKDVLGDTYDLFLYIHETPIGSGSIAQTHLCKLKSMPHEELVVKVLHPNVNVLDEDLNFLTWLLSILCYFSRMNIDWKDMFDNIRMQTNLLQEIKHMKEFRKMLLNMKPITCPRFVMGNNAFIVMTKCPGICSPMYRSLNFYLYLSSIFFFTSMTECKFHGDMHAGNILIDSPSSFSLIDYGICPSIPNGFITNMCKLFRHVDIENVKHLIDSITAIYVPKYVYEEIFIQYKQIDVQHNDIIQNMFVTFDILVKHGILINANIHLWFFQYMYLQAQVQSLCESSDSFYLQVFRYMSQKMEFRVGIPNIDVIIDYFDSKEK